MNRKGKRLLVLLVAILALGVSGLALAAFNGDPTPEEILTRAVETLDAAQDGHAMLSIEADIHDKSGWATLEVWGKKPLEGDPDGHPRFRVEVQETSEAEAQGAVAVSDGEQFWLYVPARKTVWTGAVEEMRDVEEMRAYDGELPFDSPQTFVDWLLQVSEVTLLGTEEMEGHEVYRLQFVPRSEELPEVTAAGGTGTAWVDRTRWVPLRAILDGGSMGQGQVTAELVELNVGLSDGLFTFQIPDGVEVVPVEDRKPQHLSLAEAEAVVGFDLLTPSYLPEGATLVDVVRTESTIVLRYESARGPFAVSQGTDGRAVESPPASGEPVSLRDTTGTLFTNEEGTKALLVWAEDGRTFTVSGAIFGQEAVLVAESLQ
jgi:outer membrane lipoprotein-sorting protein